jgi:carbamoylphosphate synthase large subunit
MYYIIKRQLNKPGSTFIGFSASKYLASKKSDSVIFEFTKDAKSIRKWIKKEEIILLTEDKKYFTKIIKQFTDIQTAQQKLVDEAHKKLEATMENFTEVMSAEIDEYEELRDSTDIPFIIKV